MAGDMWKDGDTITAEKLNRMNGIAEEARDEALSAQIAELKLLCDEKGRMWGAALCPAAGAPVTVPCVTVTMAPIDFTTTGGEV